MELLDLVPATLLALIIITVAVPSFAAGVALVVVFEIILPITPSLASARNALDTATTEAWKAAHPGKIPPTTRKSYY